MVSSHPPASGPIATPGYCRGGHGITFVYPLRSLFERIRLRLEPVGAHSIRRPFCASGWLSHSLILLLTVPRSRWLSDALLTSRARRPDTTAYLLPGLGQAPSGAGSTSRVLPRFQRLHFSKNLWHSVCVFETNASFGTADADRGVMHMDTHAEPRHASCAGIVSSDERAQPSLWRSSFCQGALRFVAVYPAGGEHTGRREPLAVGVKYRDCGRLAG